ncbi:MAG: peptidylprolyl isomerase, partial [Alphaproteobacteria bacterium]
ARFASLEGKRQLLDKIIDVELIADAARREGMQNDAEVRQYIENYTKQVLFVAYLQKKMAEAVEQVDENAAQTYYDQHAEEFAQPEAAKVSHILVRVAQDADDAAVAEAKKKANDLLKKVKGGADFAEVAAESSDDPFSKKKGGSLGFVTRGRYGDEFDEAAFALEAGGISEVVRGKIGFHIIKLEEKREAGQRPFTEVKDLIMRKLSMQSQQDAYDTIVGPLRSAANIQVDDQALEAVQIPMGNFGQPGAGLPPGIQGATPSTP